MLVRPVGVVVAVGMWLAHATCATADTVELTDGSRLVGTIERLANGKLTITTEFAGELELDAEKIATISVSERMVHVGVESGDQLVGTIGASQEGDRVQVSTALGPIPVPVRSITAIWPEGEPSPEVAAKQAELEKAIAAAKPKWLLKLEGGVTATEGNTDTLVGMARSSATRTTQKDTLKFYANVDYGEEDDQRNRNQYIGGMRYEYLLSPHWFLYSRGELEYDEFENLDLRTTVAAGAGYSWIKRSYHELKTNAGLGYRHETFTDGRAEDDAILDLGLDYRLDIGPYAQFTHSTVYSPSMEDFDSYRLTLDTALAVPLRTQLNWKWKTGARNEYNSDPEPGLERMDSTYYTSLVLEIER